uniref:V-type proton ATPase subunit c1 n=1 Tax=Rhizophora mucronata TaxID=61149 RepID=A0A2P2K0L6_RHIMU
MQEKTRAAAAPRKPKKGAVTSPLNAEGIAFVFSCLFGNEDRFNRRLWKSLPWTEFRLSF